MQSACAQAERLQQQRIERDVYEVEKILKKRGRGRNVQYLVKLLGTQANLIRGYLLLK